MSNDQAGRQSHSSPSSEETPRVDTHTQYAAICFREAADGDMVRHARSRTWVLSKRPVRHREKKPVASGKIGHHDAVVK